MAFPLAGKIDSSWISCEWVTDVGLPHLANLLDAHLVDGRVLNSLRKEDLKKHFKMTKKLEQLSFLSAVELLRMHDYNREVREEEAEEGERERGRRRGREGGEGWEHSDSDDSVVCMA